MTDLAERTNGTTRVETRIPPIKTIEAPPSGRPPITPTTTARWPRNAKLLVAILAVVALLGAAGTIIGFTTGDDSPTADEQAATIQTLTAERNDLVVQVSDLQADIDATVAARDELITQIAAIETASDTITAERDVLADRLAALELTTAGLDERIVSLRVARADLLEEVSALEADLTAQALLLTTVTEQRDALAALFPIRFDAAIDVDAVAGTYHIDTTQAFCDGFGACGAMPMVDQMIIRKKVDDRLEMVMDGNPAAGMMMVDGVLYAVFHSTNLTPACAGAPQLALVTTTVFPQGLTVMNDGTTQVSSLGASITVDAPATATCPAGMALHAAQLTAQT